MVDVFLCHSGQHKPDVLALYLVLRFLGDQSETSVFFDRASLTPATPFPPELAEALKSTKVGVVWLTSSFFRAKWCIYESSVLALQAGVVPEQTARIAALRAAPAAAPDAPALTALGDVGQWLGSLPAQYGDAAATMLYPVFVEADCVKDMPAFPVGNYFRLPEADFKAFCNSLSGGTNNNTLSKKDLLTKVVLEVRSILAKDRQLASRDVEQLVLLAMSVANESEANFTKPALNELFGKFRTRAAASVPPAAAAAAAVQPRIMYDLGHDEVALFNADGASQEGLAETGSNFRHWVTSTPSLSITSKPTPAPGAGVPQKTTFSLFSAKK